MVQAIGASETNLLDTSGPKRVDGEAAISLVKAADKLGVLQYVMVTSLGTGKFGWPASELGSFSPEVGNLSSSGLRCQSCSRSCPLAGV